MASAPSEASVASGSASYTGGSGNDDDLVKTIYRRLAHDGEIVSTEHIEAVDALCELQASIQRRGEASRQAQIKMICVMASLFRRCTRIEEEIARMLHYGTAEEAADSADRVERLRSEILDFTQTATLVFVVIVTIDVAALGGTCADPDECFQRLDDSVDRCLWSELAKHSKRRQEIPEELQYNEKQRLVLEELADRPYVVSESSSSWSSVLAEPGALANAAVRAAGSLLNDTSSGEAFEEFARLGRLFAESTAAQMKVQLLKSNADFMSLATRRIGQISAADRENALFSVVSAAESESGQSVLRDLVVSFLLPKRAVGQRRTLLLSRDVAAKASKNYPWVASLAHEVAMQGAEYVFKHSKSELKRTCALLAGLAMLTTSGTDDTIRKATAFNGLVQLPFLETVPPKSRKQPRLSLVSTNRAWVLYTLSSSGKPVVEVSNRGFEGLVLALLSFRETIS